MKGRIIMNREITLAAYFKEWMETFKKPAISPVTYIKYENTPTLAQQILINLIVKLINKHLINLLEPMQKERPLDFINKSARPFLIFSKKARLIPTLHVKRLSLVARKRRQR